ncbi:hypothetical protein BG004_006510 [Podila humilis]|nr:hypothetical protein BG004_006510 [Podila humilis]
MRLKIALFMALALLSLVQRVAAWEEGDFEIFGLVDALEKSEGPDVNFYSWMGVTQKTSKPEIERAFRKMSRALLHTRAFSMVGAGYRSTRLDLRVLGAIDNEVTVLLAQKAEQKRLNPEPEPQPIPPDLPPLPAEPP